ncbi:MFS transporter [Nocardia cyriacigeorgica]|uniref:Multidrug resistance transporter, MFS superfamily protein n=2 Tax=Nocardia cyriacigeorgica TaxID=135487 RepID=H6R2Y2_NOCCG|nr:MDR family MFS transporter [Nocardia cyriacigeorgica]MBF6084825.1 MFS transporter [Nocardia cyriacigeorgica]NEW35161.1 MFS transporter [Nocardia cyriacigeorgica]BDU06314.1 MFS transporter [Nocardia cyriacigeorgica]CCF63176.1 Multidrug resistance transporter, MFS superfamily protein [Nocardia cyriacigeorgica GUH-2]
MVTDTAESAVGLRSERGAILGSLMLATSLVALDSTIIATAVLTITESLGGFAQFPWLFSIYLLAQAVTVPIYGKLSDIVGRKPVILFGIGVFALGSLLCGLAGSMLGLIIFRAIQGVGAGAIQPMTMTIAGDLYNLAERAKVQGYLASVWAISSVAGPLLGGVFAEYIGWRWIFLINIPISALAGWMLLRKFTETAPRRRQRVDYLGATLLTLGAGALILGLLEGGQAWAWQSPASIAIFTGGVVVIGLFVWVQTRAEHPILPLWLFTRRVVVASSAVSLMVGALLLGLTSYVPTFAQGVLGTGALVAGLTVGALTLGWPLAASQAGRVYLRLGFRNTALIGSSLAAVGAASMLLIDAQSPLWQVAASCFLIGSGMGLVATPTLIAAQTSAEWSERGVVTSANMFARSLGSAVGVAVFGAIVNARIGDTDSPAPEVLADAVHLVFIAVLVTTVLTVLACAMMPRRSGDSL